MILTELQQEIKPLSKSEKIQLMHFLLDEIAQDELDPSRYFQPGDRHAVFSPYNEHKAAEQLTQLLQESHT